jgi:hypothetical protein
MSKNKLLIALIGVHLASAALAQTTPMTIQEWTLMQAQLKRAEQANKLRDEQKKGADAPVPVAVARACDEDLQMVAVYGIGRNLRADFMYKGATVTLSPGGEGEMGGWSVKELTPTRAMMVKRGRNAKSAKTCPLYLSAVSHDFSAPVVPLSSSSDVQVPPISPVATPAPIQAGAAQKANAAGAAK